MCALTDFAVLEDIIPITEFNKGRAGKIFEGVKKGRPKIIFKNNAAECVLIAPEQYRRLLKELEDLQLILIAEERLNTFDPEKLISSENINRKYGYLEADALNDEEAELE